jgi:hypothetical protein
MFIHHGAPPLLKPLSTQIARLTPGKTSVYFMCLDRHGSSTPFGAPHPRMTLYRPSMGMRKKSTFGYIHAACVPHHSIHGLNVSEACSN